MAHSMSFSFPSSFCSRMGCDPYTWSRQRHPTEQPPQTWTSSQNHSCLFRREPANVWEQKSGANKKDLRHDTVSP